MAKYRPVYTKIWKDKDFLNAGKDSKLLFLYFITNESITNSGIYEIPLKTIAMETGIPSPTVRELLTNGSIKNIEYDMENEIAFVMNSRKYCSGGNPAQVEKGILSEFKQTSKTFLWNSFLEINPQFKTKLSTVGQPLVKGTLPLPLPIEVEVSLNKKTPSPVKDDKKIEKEIMEYFNKAAGKRCEPTALNMGFISARLKEGYKKERFFHAIDCKVADWKNDQKMNEYLRPKTLFNASNFEGYANQVKASTGRSGIFSGVSTEPVETVKRSPVSAEVSSVWEKTVKKIKMELSEEDFSSWFSKLYPRGLDSGLLSVAAPNQLTRKRMIENYRGTIEEKWHSVAGEIVMVDFCVENLEVAV